MTAKAVVLFWFPVWAILIQGKCMTKLMKGCIRHNPALAATPGSGECASTETFGQE